MTRENNSRIQRKKTGAVLIAGAGIAGMQSALDLAGAGFKVYLVEDSLSIGGNMAGLDKTFPTNDCAMCILGPKMSDCRTNPNIEILTLSELERLEGEPGDFTAHIRRRPRYIDEIKCNGCGECALVCPVSRPDEFNQGFSDRRAVYKPFAQSVPNIFGIEKRGTSACRLACPAGTNPQGYVALISQGKFAEALKVIKQTNPFPGVCGRVCHHPCESECERGDIDEPIAICSLKRFVADWQMQRDANTDAQGESADVKDSPAPDTLPRDSGNKEGRGHPESGIKAAVIGSGPAGLSCANTLVRQGYQVVVFEALGVAGGMLRVGIPEFRLPRHVLDYEIEAIKKLGVEIRLNTPIGKDTGIEDLFKQGFKAVFIAVGAHASRKLDIPGEDLDGVILGLDFLREVNLGKKTNLGKRVAVIGGGNAAIDEARAARRLGAEKVYVVYRRSQAEMPANQGEVEQAQAEGVEFVFLAAPRQILGAGGRVNGLKCIRMKLGRPDESGRRRPVPIPNSEFTLEVDTVIPAIGQSPELETLLKKTGLERTEWSTIKIDEQTMAASLPGVFAGGDAVKGQGYLIEAIADGKRAALAIDHYLKTGKTKPLEITKSQSGLPEVKPDIDPARVIKKGRVVMPAVEPSLRIADFREVELGFDEETAKQEAGRCLACGACSECLECVKVCQPEAIDHGMKERYQEIKVGAVILSPGFEPFEAELKTEYGYSRYANVVTSPEFERLLSASGPTSGKLQRLSDSQIPKKIAFIQCVGSRDTSCDNDYCCSVGCMYAVKEAVIASEHEPGLEASIFYLDMRAFGKGFDRYYEDARDRYGVKFIRCMISSVKELQQTKNLKVQYIDESDQRAEEEFDMVVLTVGLRPHRRAVELAERLSLDLNRFGFCRTDLLEPNQTSRPGVFVCGSFQSPKDIPETVIQAGSAAARAAGLLSDGRGTLVTEKEYPPEIDVFGQAPRVGVFICRCGLNIASVIGVAELTEYAGTLENVVWAEETIYTCAQDGLGKIKQAIKEHRLNRVVVASCTPRTHLELFQNTIREAGLNPYLFEMANIRDQCSWVHASRPREANRKAKDLVRMAAARASLLEPIYKKEIKVHKKALVVGAGLSGMTAALSLSRQGFEVDLIEKEKTTGGNLRKIHYCLEKDKIGDYLKDVSRSVEEDETINLRPETQIDSFSGHVGEFTSSLTHAGPDRTRPENGHDKEQVEHGVTIIATGAQEYKPEEYLYGRDKRIITQLALEQMIAESDERLKECKSVVMIQCVGSREEPRLYCSRVCCAEAVKNSLKLKSINPDMEVYVLFRDIRTYAFKEEYYRQAREKGVVFIRYDINDKPKVRLAGGNISDSKAGAGRLQGSDIEAGERPDSEAGAPNTKLEVEVFDKACSRQITIHPDQLVLSAAIAADTEGKTLAELMKLPRNEHGFFLEAHLKLRPVDFATDGIYLAGLAHSPKFIEECIVQAQAAAARAGTILSQDTLSVAGVVARVDEDRCAACLFCVRNCPYEVPVINSRGVAEIEEVKCQGCGICAAECPAKAIQLLHYKDDQILAMCQQIGPA